MKILTVLILLVSCAHTKVHVVPGKLCQTDVPGLKTRGQLVTVDPLDSKELADVVHAATIFWNEHARKKLLYFEPLLPVSYGRSPWISVYTARVGDIPANEFHTVGKARVYYKGNFECISGTSIPVDTNGVSHGKILFRVVHEIGHAIGLDHSWQEGTVMNQYNGEYVKIGTDTLNELKELYGE